MTSRIVVSSNARLERAVADARARAETLATAAGVVLGAVSSMDARETSREAAPLPHMTVMGEHAGATPVEPGLIDVEATVDVTYTLTG